MSEEALINKVANSGLVTIDLESFLPKQEIIVFDLKDYLFMGLILKEKDFREALKQKDWSEYENRYVRIICSADAIVPLWAYMLVSNSLQPVVKDLYVGTEKEMYKHLVLKAIDQIDISSYKDQRIVIKGCGDNEIESYAYAEITKVLTPVVKSIMYGEPCSTVPIYKKKG